MNSNQDKDNKNPTLPIEIYTVKDVRNDPRFARVYANMDDDVFDDPTIQFAIDKATVEMNFISGDGIVNKGNNQERFPYTWITGVTKTKKSVDFKTGTQVVKLATFTYIMDLLIKGVENFYGDQSLSQNGISMSQSNFDPDRIPAESKRYLQSVGEYDPITVGNYNVQRNDLDNRNINMINKFGSMIAEPDFISIILMIMKDYLLPGNHIKFDYQTKLYGSIQINGDPTGIPDLKELNNLYQHVLDLAYRFESLMDTLEDRIQVLEANSTRHDEQINTNTANIAQNTNDIASNTNMIAQNATGIAENRNLIDELKNTVNYMRYVV